MICERCKRLVRPWPLQRADVCSPKGWAYCIRQHEDVAHTTEAKLRRLTDSIGRGTLASEALAPRTDDGEVEGVLF